jgi:hypothetical protein
LTKNRWVYFLFYSVQSVENRNAFFICMYTYVKNKIKMHGKCNGIFCNKFIKVMFYWRSIAGWNKFFTLTSCWSGNTLNTSNLSGTNILHCKILSTIWIHKINLNVWRSFINFFVRSFSPPLTTATSHTLHSVVIVQ